MQKTYIAIIVIVLLAGGLFFVLNNKKTEAPVTTGENQPSVNVDTTSNAPAPAPTPATTTIIKTTTTTTDTKTAPAAPTVKSFTVSGQNFSFTPNTLAVKKGDTVKITFKNLNGNHDLVIDEFNVNTGIIAAGTEKTVEFVAGKAGSFQYYCSVGQHRAMGMWGTLTVQ